MLIKIVYFLLDNYTIVYFNTDCIDCSLSLQLFSICEGSLTLLIFVKSFLILSGTTSCLQ